MPRRVTAEPARFTCCCGSKSLRVFAIGILSVLQGRWRNAEGRRGCLATDTRHAPLMPEYRAISDPGRPQASLASLLLIQRTTATALDERTPAQRRGESVGILRWVFRRGQKFLTCQVRANCGQSYDVCVLPHWDVSASIVERYNRSTSALRRHAEIAEDFRTAGWLLARESTQASIGAVA